MKYQKDSFLLIPNKEIIKGKSPQLQSIYFWLCEHTNKDQNCFPSRKTIAIESGVAERTLDKYLKELCDLGIVEKEHRFNGNEKTSNLYHINIIDQEGGATNAPGGVQVAPPVGRELRIELNPVLTQPIKDADVKKTSETFEEFMESKGYGLYEFPTPDDNVEDGWGFSQNSRVGPGRLAALQREWENKAKKQESSQKAQKTKEKRYTPFADQMVEILKTKQGLSELDGGNPYPDIEEFRKIFYRHLTQDQKLTVTTDTEITHQFEGFLNQIEGVSSFHWKNLTSFRYLVRNFNKIIRDIQGK